jgi:hypothetical protein
MSQGFNINKKGFSLILIILIIAGLVILGGALYYINKPPPTEPSTVETLNQNSNNLTSMSIPLKQFFPITGNMGDYKVSVPSGYTAYAVPLETITPLTYLWGKQDDIKAITTDSSQIDFSKAQSGVFRVRFSENVGIDDNGKINDGNGPLTEAGYIDEGVSNSKFVSGLFNGIKSVPAVAVSGMVKGKSLYLAYIFSPVDNLVLLVSLQGGNDQGINQKNWDDFVSSLNIK